ncbi:MAG TPA: outer membrane beta-barrel protein [Methylomirabilota bacterium]
MGSTRGFFPAAVLLVMVVASVGPAAAQTPEDLVPTLLAPADVPFRLTQTTPGAEEKKEEEKPKTFWEENKLFAYIENSFTANLSGSGRGGTNELRFYDNHEGYTFNAAEFSIKKDPSERYPFGYGLVITAGIDSQKNHSLGIFRDVDDQFAFRNTEKFDLLEAYGSGLIPLGSGLTLKAGKFVTLLGYEVIESPNNLNFSRGYLFSLAVPLTTTGALASYTFTDWFSATAGFVLGWDDSQNVNDPFSYTGQFAFTPVKDFTANLNWIVGPEQTDPRRFGDIPRDQRFYVNDHIRYVLDFVFAYTGFKNTTLALNVDYGHEDSDAFLRSLNTRQNTNATWWGWALSGAYDWTDKIRTAVRQEYFRDANGARTGIGAATDLWSTTATFQYKIWKGLVGRLEYRHDQSDDKVFRVRYSRPDITSQGLLPRGKNMDTISVSLYYSFF